MTLVRALGKPDISLTFTTNPKWPEIQQALFAGESAADRPDLCASVFKIKLQSLHDLLKANVLGRVIAHTYTIEWQKRELTHAHIVLIMLADDKPHTPEKVDALVSAEIPDATTQPRLFNTITTQMIHGPCGHMNPNCVCMEGEGASKHCTKNFLKDFLNVTKLQKNGHALYRGRSTSDGGKTVEIKRGDKT